MSVILDALKRVQDENRRRGATPVAQEPGPMHGSNALLRRLSAPEAPRVNPGRRPGPTVWIGALAVAGIAVVVTVLWWMQPSFSGPRANNGRALLTDLTASRPESVPFSPPSAANGATAQAGSELGSGRLMAASDRLPNVPGDGELDDLSSNLPEIPELPPVAADSGTDEPAPDFSLEVEDRTAAAPAANGIDLTSSRAAAPSAGRAAPGRSMGSNGETVSADRARSVPATGRTLLDPGVRDAFEEGVRAQKEGDNGRAEEAYKRALRRDPHNAKVNANLGVLYERQGRLETAERHLRQAAAVEPNNASVHNNLGVVLYRMGNYDGALIEFNRTLSLDPERLDAYTNKGLIFTRWGRYEDAQRAFMQVLALNPDDALANYNLGLVYEEVNDYGRAVDHYYRFLEVGGMEHPKIAEYLAQHLGWLEDRLDGGAQRR